MKETEETANPSICAGHQQVTSFNHWCACQQFSFILDRLKSDERLKIRKIIKEDFKEQI